MSRRSRSRSPVRNRSPLTEENQQFVESLRQSPTFSKSLLPSRSPQTFSEEDYPVTMEDPIRPTLDEDEWTTVIKKSRKQRGLEREPIPNAPSTVSVANPAQLQQGCRSRSVGQKINRYRNRRNHTNRWSKGGSYDL
jgi:hypothetical protein